MSGTIKIKPAGHNMVRNPDAGLRHLDPAGEVVELNTYWLRRLAAEEVVEVKEPVANTETPSEVKPSKGKE
jgi:hypothetical protein